MNIKVYLDDFDFLEGDFFFFHVEVLWYLILNGNCYMVLLGSERKTTRWEKYLKFD